MTKAHLRPCGSCARHVRVSEAACPFCGAALGEEMRAAAPPQAPSARLSRAALFALGTSTAAALGCSSAVVPSYGGSPIPIDASADGAGISEPAYGAPSFPLDASYDGPGIGEPAYGAAPTPVELDGGGDAPDELGDAADGAASSD